MLINALSKDSEWDLVDCLRQSEGNGQFNPVTYGEIVIDEKTGLPTAGEPAMTGEEDMMTEQALDYIFQIKPKLLKTDPEPHRDGNLAVSVMKTKLEKLKIQG